MVLRWMVIVAALLLAGCSGDDERRRATSTPTQTPSPTATATPEPELAVAHSTEDCVRLWNEDALDDTFQVTANEFVAELAPVDVHIAYEQGDCTVVAPIGGRRIATFTAEGGRRPFTIPERRRLKRGERFDDNARADDTGRLELDS